LAIALPFFLLNYATFAAFLPPYYHSYGAFLTPTIKSLFGPFISPSRGLFLYTPIFLFSFYGFFLKLRTFRSNYPDSMLDILLAGIILAHCLLISIWFMWWGGYSIGARMLSDMIPFQIYFLIPVIQLIASASKLITPLRLAFAVSLLFSFAIQYMGVATEALWAWNSIPTQVEYDQARLWDWSDPPLLRGLTWLENMFPLNPKVYPAEVHLFCIAGVDPSKCKTSVELYTLPKEKFRWEATPPPGVKVVPAQGQNQFERSRLAIHLTKTGYLPGDYNLGNLKISAIHTGGLNLSNSVSVPIILHVELPDQ
jgi:hypothetical protein